MSMAKSISINCDMGENDTVDRCRNDLLLMPWISQCNVAVGGHIGNAETIAFTFQNAADHALDIGLHPSYPDRKYFGRSRQNLTMQEIVSSLQQQIDDALNIAENEGVTVNHIKFHGQLYNDLEMSSNLRESVLNMVTQYSDLKLMGHSGGQLMMAAVQRDIDFIREAFADRRYMAAHRLQPRSEDGALITEAEDAAAQALGIAHKQQLTLASGKQVEMIADSLCVHADTPNSLQILRTIKGTLAGVNIEIN